MWEELLLKSQRFTLCFPTHMERVGLVYTLYMTSTLRFFFVIKSQNWNLSSQLSSFTFTKVTVISSIFLWSALPLIFTVVFKTLNHLYLRFSGWRYICPTSQGNRKWTDNSYLGFPTPNPNRTIRLLFFLLQ